MLETPDSLRRELTTGTRLALAHADGSAVAMLKHHAGARAAETRNIAIYEHLGMAIVGRENRRSLTGAVIPVVLLRTVWSDTRHRSPGRRPRRRTRVR
ncbi:hypothetical protein [Luteimicrobium subarcticum]|uniref:Uncharacterized protein n=1 Tax=Luteimicrobium subarcticum TaxID=620910 RepID=A0A2M8W3U9_9MICO|nr:hypothetical protein [Luteimicrobium subarcticum]PJI85569.1 hypothetical protein CLV34_2751 [Luteimicrobium subarcticum]